MRKMLLTEHGPQTRGYSLSLWRRIICLAVGSSLVIAVTPADAVQSALTLRWGPAQALSPIPGEPHGWPAEVDAHPSLAEDGLQAMACTAPGSCVAVGKGWSGAVVVEEVGGVWRGAQAIELPAGADEEAAALSSVACTAEGSCVAVGTDGRPMIVSESGGVWAQAREIALPREKGRRGELNESKLTGVACAAVGHCVAVGDFEEGSPGFHRVHAFVVSETAGSWGQPQEVVSSSVVRDRERAGEELSSVSCPTAGGCVALGVYGLREVESKGIDSQSGRAMTLTQVGGVWGQATALSLPSSLRRVHSYALVSISCPAVGRCVSVGEDEDQPFALGQVAGIWSQAARIAPPHRLRGVEGALISVDCQAVGACVAVGGYLGANRADMPMVVSASRASWGRASEVSLKALAKAGGVTRGIGNPLVSVACLSTRTCAAIGSEFTVSATT
jgi:hypothetical protein